MPSGDMKHRSLVFFGVEVTDGEGQDREETGVRQRLVLGGCCWSF